MRPTRPPDASLPPVSADSARVQGPSAFGGSVRRFVELTLTLARTEFKLRYFGSVLGYLWSLMRPLLFFGVLYLVFTHVFNVGKGIPHYAVYMLTGIVMWTYFIEATTGCVPSLVNRESMLRKVRFPRLVIPLSVSLTAMFNMTMNLIAVLVFALASGIPPTLSWFELLPLFLAYVLLASGAGMLLSAVYVRYRDIQPIWDVISQALFYASPIIYIAAYYRKAGVRVEHLAMLSPIAMLNTQIGHVLIGHVPLHGAAAQSYGPNAFPSIVVVSGGMRGVFVPIAIILAVFAIGWWVFIREAPRVAENL